MAKISTLVDDFPGSSLNGQWNASSGVTVSGGKAILDINANDYLGTSTTYDLTESQFQLYVQFRNVNDPENCKLYIQLNGTGEFIQFYKDDDDILYMQVGVGTEGVNYGFVEEASVNWGGILSSWLRIREHGHTLYWESSIDGFNWNTLHYYRHQIDLTALSLKIVTNGTTVDTASIQHVNTTPPALPQILTDVSWRMQPTKTLHLTDAEYMFMWRQGCFILGVTSPTHADQPTLLGTQALNELHALTNSGRIITKQYIDWGAA